MSWTIPVETLSAQVLGVSAVLGTSIDLLLVRTDHAFQWNVSYSTGDSFTIQAQASLDGANWFDVAAPFATGPVGGNASAIVPKTAFNQPARFVRVVGTAPTGSPVITALVTSR